MKIAYDPAFLKKLKKVDVRIRRRAKDRILLFSKDPTNKQLNNHPLKKEYAGYRSIDITNDWRAVYKAIQERDTSLAYFITLGTHKQLYRNN